MTDIAPLSSTRLWKGLSAPEAVTQLVKEMEDVESVTFLDFQPQPALQQRLDPMSPSLQKLWLEARKLREEERMPFYDALIELAEQQQLPEQLLHDIFLYHETLPEVMRIPVEEVSPELIRGHAESLGRGKVFGIASSVVRRDKREAHIPMLDLRWSPDERNVPFAQALLAQFGIGGLLLNSGRSFHFYGFGLLSPEEYRVFLGQSLLLGPLVDRRWVGHQLMEGASVLRLTSSAEAGHTTEPTVVAEVPISQATKK